MAYTTIDDPSAYFQTTLYTGNDTARSITNSGNSDLQPDWIWIKGRSETVNHVLFDSVRGAQKELNSDTNEAEETQAQMVTSFNSNGFGMGTSGGSNSNTITYAAWQWKAGTSFTNDASGTGIGSIDSAGSVNNDAGFSIVTYTGNDSVATVKHGLSSAPKMMIIKDRTADTTNDWLVYHDAIGNTKSIKLNLTAAAGTDAPAWNNTSPTSSVFTIARNGNINGDGNTIVAYCFAEKQGYSKFGSYKGNGNADGTFISTGFKPAWIMIKATDQDGEGWFMFDNKRDVDNAVDKHLIGNANGAEASGSHAMDFVSNGIKIRNGGDGTNTSAKNYVYMAFAKNPFVTSTGVPATAR